MRQEAMLGGIKTYKDHGGDGSCRRGWSTGCLAGAAERGGAIIVGTGGTETGSGGLLSQEGDAVRLEE